MNINFNDATYEKLKYLATLEGRSVAAYISQKMDELTGQLVNVEYSLNDIPEGTPLAHMDLTPKPRIIDRDTDEQDGYANW
ncbi:hypothetical protein [Escherichia phage UPEC06]|nr:hypothetical protein [Escherichia phage UPEC06]